MTSKIYLGEAKSRRLQETGHSARGKCGKWWHGLSCEKCTAHKRASIFSVVGCTMKSEESK